MLIPLLFQQVSSRSGWEAGKQFVGWEGLSFIVLCPLAIGLLAMAKYRAARILFGLSAVALAVKIVTSTHAYLPPRWMSFGDFIGVSISVLFLLWMLIWVDAEAKHKNPQRADIFTALVIDSVTDDGTVRYHLEVENGLIEIQNIRTRVKTPEFVGSEMDTPLPRRVPPKGRVSIPGDVAVIKPRRGNSLIVDVAYTATLHHEEKELWSTTRFLVGPEIKPGIVNPEAVNSGEGVLAFDEQAKNIDVPAQFAQPKGTFLVVLNEVGRDGNPNTCSIRNEHRRLVFDPVLRTVVFETHLREGKVVQLSLGLDQVISGHHVIAVQWNSSGALLKVDGGEARSPNFIDSES